MTRKQWRKVGKQREIIEGKRLCLSSRWRLFNTSGLTEATVKNFIEVVRKKGKCSVIVRERGVGGGERERATVQLFYFLSSFVVVLPRQELALLQRLVTNKRSVRRPSVKAQCKWISGKMVRTWRISRRDPDWKVSRWHWLTTTRADILSLFLHVHSRIHT